MLDILLFYAILACVFTFGKQIVTLGQPFFVCAARLLPAGIILLSTVYFFDKKQFRFEKKHLKPLLLLTLFIFFMDVFRFLGLQYVPGSYGALLATLSPFMAALFSYYVYQETITWRQGIAMVLGATAVIPIIINNLQSCTDCSQWQLALGYGALFISTLAIVIRSYFLKNLVDTLAYSSSLVLGISFILCGIASLGLSLCFEQWNPVPFTNGQALIPFLLFIMVFYNIIAQSLFAYLVKKYPITLVTFFMLSTPLITASLYWIFYGIKVDTYFFYACALLTTSFILFTYKTNSK